MKLNISFPTTGCQKLIEIDDENKLRAFYEKRISHEVAGDSLGDDFKGYVFRISGGNDKQGFPMKQGVLRAVRVRRAGARKRKSVRGCIVGPDLAVVNLVVINKGDAEIPGLTDETKPRRLGPKRADKIRELFGLTKEDDVRGYVIRRTVQKDGKKAQSKAPKIQRLNTPQRLSHKRYYKTQLRKRGEKAMAESKAYNALVAQRAKEQRAARAATIAKRRSVSRKMSESATAK